MTISSASLVSEMNSDFKCGNTTHIAGKPLTDFFYDTLEYYNDECEYTVYDYDFQMASDDKCPENYRYIFIDELLNDNAAEERL